MTALLTKVFQIFGTALSVAAGGAGIWQGWQGLKNYRDGDGSQARDNMIGVIMGMAGIAVGVLITQVPSFLSF